MDRNFGKNKNTAESQKSLSARRAWIEIIRVYYKERCIYVALRKESVDRNFGMERKMQAAVVALRKESVDRNSPA